MISSVFLFSLLSIYYYNSDTLPAYFYESQPVEGEYQAPQNQYMFRYWDPEFYKYYLHYVDFIRSTKKTDGMTGVNTTEVLTTTNITESLPVDIIQKVSTTEPEKQTEPILDSPNNSPQSEIIESREDEGSSRGQPTDIYGNTIITSEPQTIIVGKGEGSGIELHTDIYGNPIITSDHKTLAVVDESGSGVNLPVGTSVNSADISSPQTVKAIDESGSGAVYPTDTSVISAASSSSQTVIAGEEYGSGALLKTVNYINFVGTSGPNTTNSNENVSTINTTTVKPYEPLTVTSYPDILINLLMRILYLLQNQESTTSIKTSTMNVQNSSIVPQNSTVSVPNSTIIVRTLPAPNQLPATTK